MSAIGSLQVILEVEDGNFTTRIVRAGTALEQLEGKATVAVNAVNNVTNKMSSGIGSVMGWAIALGEARHAAETLNAVFGSWVEKIVEINSEIDQTTALLAGFSKAASQVDRLKEGLNSVNAVMNMAAQSPFSFKSLQDTFVKIKTAGVDPLNGSMKSLTDAIAAFGGDDQRLTRAGYAIQEMSGRGVVSLQNLRRQLGQDIPGAVKAMAESMYMTVEQLDAAVTKGTLDSRNALQLMLDEFDRLYGGAALARMNTFRGQVAQLNTELMRLASVAGGMTQGGDPNQSFYHSLVQGMSQLNSELSSPEMMAAGVTINNFLKNMVEGATQLIPIIPTLANNIGLLAKALELLAAVLAAKVIGMGMEMLGTQWIKFAEGLRMVIDLASAAPAKISALFSTVSSAAAGALQVISRLGTRIASLGMGGAEGIAGLGVGAAESFAIGLSAVALPAALAVAGAVYAISQGLERIPGQAALAGQALQRLRQGDVTQGNQDQAKQELDQLREKVRLLREQAAVVNDLQSGKGTGGKSLLDVGGAFGQKGSPGFTELYNQISPYLQASGGMYAGPENELKATLARVQAEIKAELKADSDELAVYEADLAAAPLKLAQARAQRLVEDVRVAISADFQRISTQYREEIDKINAQREELSKDPAHNQGALLQLNDSQVAVTKASYAQREADLQSYLAKEAALIAHYAKQNNLDLMREHQVIYAALQDDLKRAEDQAQAALGRLGIVKTSNDNKDFNKQTGEAKTLIQNMQAQVASLNAQLNDTGSYAAKIKEEFSSTGKLALLGGINSQQGQEALHLAEELDTLRASIKRVKEETAAGNQINLGLNRATAELNGYLLKLNDPNMTDAQTKFVLFQNQMEGAVTKMLSSMKVGESGVDQFSSAFLRLSDAAQQAIATMRSATELSQLESLVKQAHNAHINAMPPAERARAQAKDFNDHLNEVVNQISNDPRLNAGQKLQARMQAQQARSDYSASENLRVNRADANAARPGDNAVAQLTARASELRAQIAGGNSELAKWNSLIASNPTKYAAQADAIRQWAAQVDNLQKTLKKAQAADKALTDLQDRGKKASAAIDMEKQYLGLGKMISAQRQLVDYQLKVNADLAKVATGPNAATQLPQAKTAATNDVNQEGLLLIMKTVEANKTAEDQIRKGFDTTLAARRQAASEEIAFEGTQLQDMIGKYVTDKTLKEQLTAETTSYIAAKYEELAQKMEDPLQKMARQWQDLSGNIMQYESQAMNSFVDNLTQQLTTGKAKWTDFANWAIQELVRIQLKAAMAPLNTLLSGATSGLGSWVGSTVNGWINGPNNAALSQVGAGLTSVGGVVNHSGGMAGSEFDSVRHLPAHVWGNAPRFHTGGYLASNEVPIIAQKGEAVFTSGQLGAIGSLNHNYTFVEQALSALVDAANQIVSMPQAPANIAPASNYGAPGSASANAAGVPVTLNVQNQTAMPVSAVASTPKFDGEQMVIDVVIRSLQSPGPLRNAVKSVR